MDCFLQGGVVGGYGFQVCWVVVGVLGEYFQEEDEVLFCYFFEGGEFVVFFFVFFYDLGIGGCFFDQLVFEFGLIGCD